MTAHWSEKAKVAVISAIITAVTSIVIAYLGLYRNQSTDKPESEKPAEETYQLKGTVRYTDNRPAGNSIIYAAEKTSQITPDDNGTFSLANAHNEIYWFIVKDQTTNREYRLLIDPAMPTVGTEDIVFTYNFVKESQ
jgi:hypothetical protein